MLRIFEINQLVTFSNHFIFLLPSFSFCFQQDLNLNDWKIAYFLPPTRFRFEWVKNKAYILTTRPTTIMKFCWCGRGEIKVTRVLCFFKLQLSPKAISHNFYQKNTFFFKVLINIQNILCFTQNKKRKQYDSQSINVYIYKY